MGQQLHQVMGWPGPMTYRQYLAWEAWLEVEMNNPGRLEFYIMRLMWETRYSALRTVPKFKIPGTIDTEQFRVKIVRKNMNEQQESNASAGQSQEGVVRSDAEKRRIISEQQRAIHLDNLRRMGVKVVDQHGNTVVEPSPKND